MSIAAYNVEAYIEECLEIFVKCKELEALDIIVVDDVSKDNTCEKVQAYVDRQGVQT